MRPIDAVVDASNYVMLELGQPTHAYDLDRLPSPALGARAARPGERLTTLDGTTRTLGLGAQPDCVIVDGSDEAIGIAGIMGGASSEVHAGTTRIALEAILDGSEFCGAVAGRTSFSYLSQLTAARFNSAARPATGIKKIKSGNRRMGLMFHAREGSRCSTRGAKRPDVTQRLAASISGAK
jgi:hypothetical protein